MKEWMNTKIVRPTSTIIIL